MKKTIALILTVLLLSSLIGPVVFAEENTGVGIARFDPINAFYNEDSELVVEGILANVSNFKITHIKQVKLEILDKNKKQIALDSFSDNNLYNVSLNPGETIKWSFIISNPAIGDISHYYYTAHTDTIYINKPVFTSGIYIVINNKPLQTNVPAILTNGRTLVPMRAIFEQLGATISWDSKTNTVTSKRGDVTITHKINTDEMIINDKKIKLDTSSKLIKGSTMVPLRAITEAFGGVIQNSIGSLPLTVAITID